MSKFRLALILIFLTIGGVARSEQKPNVIFFFTDDQTISTIGCYGNEIVQTPNIDLLAREGTRFRNAFVSHSICWVSRTTVLTGLTGRSYGTYGSRDVAKAEAVQTLYPDLLRQIFNCTINLEKTCKNFPTTLMT